MERAAKLEMYSSVQLILVEASKLSLDDEFMKYQPTKLQEARVKNWLTSAIQENVRDFWTTKYDPSLNERGNICFVEENLPATGKSFEWWRRTAKGISRYNKSRLGSIQEYIALMGVIIKTLIERGWNVEKAWNAVCCDPKDLFEYMKEEQDDYHNNVLTLGNLRTPKVVDDGNLGYWVVASEQGSWYKDSLTNMQHEEGSQRLYDITTGWIVFKR